MQRYMSGLYSGRQPPYKRSAVHIRTDENHTPPMPGQEDFLMHYGISGMKWHVRRYQNEDGSYTEEGKKRYGRESKPESEGWKKSDASQLSDEELNRRTNRLQRERNYRDLTTTEAERKKAQRKSNFDQIKNDALKKILIGGAVSLAAIAMKGHYKQAASVISHFAKTKIAPLKAAKIIKDVLKNDNIPDRVAPVKEILGKHVFQI